MTAPNNRTRTTGKGGAAYLFENMAPAEWLVAAVPGANAARDAWLAENEAGLEIHRAYRASSRALLALRDSDPTTSKLEAAERAHKALGARLDAQARKSLAALRRFDDLVAGDGLGAEERRMAAARYALARQEEAADLWTRLQKVLDDRDAARVAAGAPGRHWTERTRILPGEVGSELHSTRLLEARVSGFDVDAVAEVAEDGHRPPTKAEIEAAGRKRAEEIGREVAQAAHRRGRAEGF